MCRPSGLRVLQTVHDHSVAGLEASGNKPEAADGFGCLQHLHSHDTLIVDDERGWLSFLVAVHALLRGQNCMTVDAFDNTPTAPVFGSTLTSDTLSVPATG